MSLSMDPAVEAAIAPLLAAADGQPPPPAGDVGSRRAIVEALFEHFATIRPSITDVSVTEHTTTSHDGADIALRLYAKEGAGAGPGSAVLHVHGGGMIVGSVEDYDSVVRGYVSATGVPMLAVDYRLAPEHPHPTPVEDCHAALVWLAEHAPELGVDPARIAVMGDSAGGGLAAGVALLARDRGGPAISRQILVYPMLDDRTTVVDESIAPFLTWTYDDNITGWGALLGRAAGGETVSSYAAPARATDLTGLPPAYVDVGELDIFRDEDVAYAGRLAATGTSVELHVHPGCPHAYEAFAPDAGVSRRTLADRVRVIAAL